MSPAGSVWQNLSGSHRNQMRLFWRGSVMERAMLWPSALDKVHHYPDTTRGVRPAAVTPMMSSRSSVVAQSGLYGSEQRSINEIPCCHIRRSGFAVVVIGRRRRVHRRRRGVSRGTGDYCTPAANWLVVLCSHGTVLLMLKRRKRTKGATYRTHPWDKIPRCGDRELVLRSERERDH